MYHTLRLICVLGLLLFFKSPIIDTVHSATTLDESFYLPLVFQTGSASIAGCPVFPSNNIWNTPVDTLVVHPKSSAYISSIGLTARAHADFGSGEWPPGSGSPIGIPYIIVSKNQPEVPIHYTDYGDESDPGPFPIPPGAPIEGGPASDGDRHVLVVDRDACMLYELFAAYPRQDSGWNASSGAAYDLRAHGPLRPSGWTSADAAGLPILPGLVRYEDVAAGEIRHALRFTASCTQNAFVWPARHRAGSCGADFPPMGQRFRLKASFNISSAPAQVRPILTAMKKYGIILADNGSPWYFSGTPDSRWNNDALHWLDSYLTGASFEAVDATILMVDPDSGQARLP